MSREARICAVAFCAVILAGAAVAQTSLDEPLDERSAKRLDRLEKSFKELRAIVFQGRETGQPVVVQPADAQGQVTALSDRLNQFEQSLSHLNGQIEVIGHDLDQVRRETADLRAENAALKQQLAAVDEAVRASAAPAPLAPSGARGDPAREDDPAAALAAAKAAYAGQNYASAEAQLRDYVGRWGEGPGGAEARYYLGKTLISRRAWSEAATTDIGALRGWPRTRWAPDAIVDLARSLNALGRSSEACQALGELGRRYPKAGVAVTRGAAEVRERAACG